ncbi:LptF/LptG family permease [Thermodesulfatator autotrophicus]|uniref:LPS export ABC transporter permease LptG n=1 Tax=Thermodesulfatator autotrophicus TaxID=1795632 RepID=A0A177E715_9BACT|nr:LptF/LptG family permease [Thermodesulfatator autotrophicus]OAG27685.1 hypothetical protein TH606_05680 [Thermodesulfatator autotrophicus]
MKIYINYLLKPYLIINLLTFPLFVGIYSLIEFFDKLDNVVRAKVSIYILAEYVALKLPEVLFNLWPLCLTLAGILAFAFLSRGNELLAFRTLGFSASRLLFPFVVFSLALSFLFIIISDNIMPQTTYQALFLWETKVKKRSPEGVIIKGKLHFKGADSFFIGQIISSSVTYVRDVVYAKVDKEGLPLRIVWAKEAFFERGRWIFKNGVIKEKKENFTPRWFKEYSLVLEFDPETVMLVKRTPRFHTLPELWEQRAFLEQAGLPAILTESEIAYRLCYPLLSVPLFLFSLPWLMKQHGRASLGKGLGLSLFFMATGLLVFMLFKYTGDKGLISPFIAQALGLVFLAFSGLTLFRVFRV